GALVHADRRVLGNRQGPPPVEDRGQLVGASLESRRAPVGNERRHAHRGDDANHGDQDEELREGEPPTVEPAATLQLPKRSRHYHERSSDRKSTRLNSSHVAISYAVFCLKKKI